MIKIRVLKTHEELLEIREEWSDLIADSNFSAPFYSWYWYERWWKYFGHQKELYIICVRNGKRLLAIAPMMKVKLFLRGIPARQICFMDNGISPRNHILHRKDDESLKAVRKIFMYFLNHRKEWDVINLRSIEASALYLNFLLSMDRINLIVESGLRSPFIKIRNDFETYIGEIFTAKQRRARKRGLKKVAREGEFRVENYMKPDEIKEALKIVFQVSHRSWKGDIKTDMAATPASKKFYEEMTTHFASFGQVRIWILFLGDRAIAADYFLSNGEKVFFLINDFDKNYIKLSPGQALLFHVLEGYHNEKIAEFDFGGDDLDYKKKWATDFREHKNIQIFSKKSYSNLIYICKSILLPILRDIKKKLPVRKQQPLIALEE